MPWLSPPRREPSRRHEPCKGRSTSSCYFIQILSFYITHDLFHLSLSRSSGFQPRSFSQHPSGRRHTKYRPQSYTFTFGYPFTTCFHACSSFFYPKSSVYYRLVRYPEKKSGINATQFRRKPTQFSDVKYPSISHPSYLIDAISKVVCSSLLPLNHVPASSTTTYSSRPFITMQCSAVQFSHRRCSILAD